MIERWGATGETGADVVTMIINAMISFFVFFPIFKVIFKREDEDQDDEAGTAPEREPVTV
jgi:cellobiose-specific phosphotransferase system component IIC